MENIIEEKIKLVSKELEKEVSRYELKIKDKIYEIDSLIRDHESNMQKIVKKIDQPLGKTKE